MTESSNTRFVKYQTAEGEPAVMAFKRGPEIDAMTDEDLIREYGARIEADLRRRGGKDAGPA